MMMMIRKRKTCIVRYILLYKNLSLVKNHSGRKEIEKLIASDIEIHQYLLCLVDEVEPL